MATPCRFLQRSSPLSSTQPAALPHRGPGRHRLGGPDGTDDLGIHRATLTWATISQFATFSQPNPHALLRLVMTRMVWPASGLRKATDGSVGQHRGAGCSRHRVSSLHVILFLIFPPSEK